jgi:DNA-directed RNA polymerase specialized sigma24 family protein
MKLPRSTKSTPASRLLLVTRLEFEDWTYAEAAAGFGVSVRTVAKWVHHDKHAYFRSDTSSGIYCLPQ